MRLRENNYMTILLKKKYPKGGEYKVKRRTKM